MKKTKPLLTTLYLIFLAGKVLFAQNGTYPAGYFRSPLDIPIVLAGNFGELRSNHFHSGIDIKTQGVEGKRIYCAANGYISRIKISTGGYGKVLYVTHPNGFTTVYAHLQKFNEAIEAYVKRAQYARQSYTIELFPPASAFPLEKSDIIAISGNSGGSLAPHLHFEIRETKSEKPVNPLFFGFDIQDDVQPTIRTISIYPLNENSFVDGVSRRKDYSVVNVGGRYRLNPDRTPKVYGDIGFGIETFDRLNGAGNHCGIYAVELTKDGKLIYEHEMEKFSFYETRYINAHIDYDKYMRSKRRTQRSHLLANNKLSIYGNVDNHGTIQAEHGTSYEMKYQVKDSYGNITSLRFSVTGDSTDRQVIPRIRPQHQKLLKCKERNSFQQENVIVYMPPNVLYEDLLFNFYLDDTLKNALTPTYMIHNEYVPLQSYIMISIKAPGISERIKQKSLVVSYTEEDGIYPEGGTWKGNYMVVKTRSFGGYAIMADTVKPVIRPVNISFNENMRNKWSIMVKIADNLSGIDEYIPKVDGKWILMEYDTKRDMLTHHFDDIITPGRHTFELTVTDKVGNVSIYKTEFIR